MSMDIRSLAEVICRGQTVSLMSLKDQISIARYEWFVSLAISVCYYHSTDIFAHTKSCDGLYGHNMGAKYKKILTRIYMTHLGSTEREEAIFLLLPRAMSCI